MAAALQGRMLLGPRPRYLLPVANLKALENMAGLFLIVCPLTHNASRWYLGDEKAHRGLSVETNPILRRWVRLRWGQGN